jgi:hypothetical protein
MQKNGHLKKPTPGKTYALVILFILLLGYVIPIAIHPDPLGTDVYTHIVYTDIMLESKSIKNFYEKCLEKEDISYDYPFGLWLFGAIVSKVSGLDVYTLSYILPTILILQLVLVFYVYSGILISSVRYRLMSVIFLLSMPVIAIEILEYRTSVFSMPIILSVFYFLLEKKTSIVKTFLLSTLLIFCLCFVHTGSYISNNLGPSVGAFRQESLHPGGDSPPGICNYYNAVSIYPPAVHGQDQDAYHRRRRHFF